MDYTFTNPEKTAGLAAAFAKSLKKPIFSGIPGISKKTHATVVGLYGDLGSGKTFFMQAAGRALGITENIVSPTFVIEKIYKLQGQEFSHLVHIDAYRLEKAQELLHLGWVETINNPENLVCIEWPERVAEIMPNDHIKIKFTFVDTHTREISFENYEIK